MSLKPVLLRVGAYTLSAAGLALAVKASLELNRHDWPRGLSHAGWSLYLMLVPFMNLGALRAALGRPVSDVGRNKALRLPLPLSLVSLLALVLAVAGLVLTMAEQLGL